MGICETSASNRMRAPAHVAACRNCTSVSSRRPRKPSWAALPQRDPAYDRRLPPPLSPSHHRQHQGSRRHSRNGTCIAGPGNYTATVERASDKHAKNLLVIVKEASGVEDEIWGTNDSLGYERLVAVSNSIRAEGRFVDLIRQADTDRHDGTPPHPEVKANQTPSTDSRRLISIIHLGESLIAPGRSRVIDVTG